MKPSKKEKIREKKEELSLRKGRLEKEISPDEIEGSCRLWIPSLFVTSFAWLFIGTALKGFALFELVFPELSPDSEILSYGRLCASASTALLYGFAIQLLFSIGIYSTCVSIKSKMIGGALMFGAITLWNIGVFTAAFANLTGGTTGFEWFELPYYSTTFLIISSLFFIIELTLIVINRTEETLHPSNWFYLIFSAIVFVVLTVFHIFLLIFPLSGVAQILFHNWLKNIAFNVLIVGGIVGCLFWFIPYLLNTNIFSRRLALFAFFGILLFGGYGGISPSMPFPRWIYETNRALSIFLIIPLIAVFINVFSTFKYSKSATTSSSSGKYTRYFSLTCLILGLYFITGFAETTTELSQIVEFTIYSIGRDNLLIFCALVFIGIGFGEYVLPGLLSTGGVKMAGGSPVSMPVICGGLITAAGFLTGGFIHGANYYDFKIKFVDAVISIKPFIFAGFIGCSILLIGEVLFLFRCGRLLTNAALLKINQWRVLNRIENTEDALVE